VNRYAQKVGVQLRRDLTQPTPYVMMVSSMVKKVKMPENVLRFFRETGSEGGKARAEKHTREELSKWGKKGGRPRGSGRKQKGTK
jgi:hypothetical protein